MRQQLYAQLDPRAWQKAGLSPLNRLIAFVIVLSVISSVLETEITIRETHSQLFNVANIIFGILFTLEYLTRIWVAGEVPRYQGFTGRLRYMISPYAVIDLVAILPFLLTVGGADAYVLRLLRLLRIVRLAKLGRYSTALRIVIDAIYARRYELLVSLLAAFTLMLFSAAALHITEGANNPESFGSIPRALWWGAATITKVGYGGAFPVTVLGKFFAVVFAIAAVCVVAMPTGILAASFSSAFRQERERKSAD